jgi:Zn-dependent protease
MNAMAQSPDATPILDSGIWPKAKRKNIGSIVIGFVFAIPFAMIVISVANDTRRFGEQAANLVFVTYLLCLAVAVIVHEMGHLLAGWMVGFRFSSITIGPIALRMEFGKLRAGIRRTLPAGGYAGMHIDRIRRLRRRLLRFIAGGPLANLLTAALAASWLAYSPPRSIALASSLELFWMMSALIAIINLLPLRIGMLYTDGARMLMLRSSLPKARRWISLTAIGNQAQNGVRARLWKRSWLNAAAGLGDKSVDDFTGNWIAYAAANDRKEGAVAAAHLEKCLELANLLGPSLRDLVAMEATVFSSWFREDAVTAQKWFGQINRLKSISKLFQFRADIALHCARREFPVALSRWQEAHVFIEKLPNTPIKRRLLEGFLEWRSEIDQRQQAHNGSVVATSTA